VPIVAFLIVAFLYFMLLFLISDSAQPFLYDQVVDGLWWRCLLSALPLALLAILFPVRLDTMFTESPWGLLLQCVAWYLTLWLICQYQNVHALVLGITAAALCSWMATMAADSLLGPATPTP
jgi:hypothetical protein